MTSYIDPAVRISVGVSEILALPRCPMKDRLLTRAARKTRNREAVEQITAAQIRWAHVEAEAHRLEAAADRIYERMAADRHAQIRHLIETAAA